MTGSSLCTNDDDHFFVCLFVFGFFFADVCLIYDVCEPIKTNLRKTGAAFHRKIYCNCSSVPLWNQYVEENSSGDCRVCSSAGHGQFFFF